MYELVVVAISFLPIFLVVLPATSLCTAPKKKAQKAPPPQQPVLPRYKPGHIPNFADGFVDLIEDDTLYEVKTEIAFPEKEGATMSSAKSKNDKSESKNATPSPTKMSNKST